MRMLRAARDAGVRRVVLTSSFAAIGCGHPVRSVMQLELAPPLARRCIILRKGQIEGRRENTEMAPAAPKWTLQRPCGLTPDRGQLPEMSGKYPAGSRKRQWRTAGWLGDQDSNLD
jgi:hypothetical protein